MFDKFVEKTLASIAGQIKDYADDGLLSPKECCFAKVEIAMSLLINVMEIIAHSEFEARQFVGSVCTDLNVEIAKKWWN